METIYWGFEMKTRPELIIVDTKLELDKCISWLEEDESVESYEIEFGQVNSRGLGALLMMDNPRQYLAKLYIKWKESY